MTFVQDARMYVLSRQYAMDHINISMIESKQIICFVLSVIHIHIENMLIQKRF